MDRSGKPADDDASDDISLLSFDGEEDAQAAQPVALPVGLTAGVRSWAQVDSRQLKHLSLRITQRVTADVDKLYTSAPLIGTREGRGSGLPEVSSTP